MKQETLKREKVLRKLMENARMNNNAIAEELGMDVGEVSAIVEELERSNTIHGYTAILDDSASEGKVVALIELRVTPTCDGGFDAVARRIARFPEVRDLFLVSGSYDLLLTVEGDTLQDVASFVSERLSTIAGVLSTSTSFQLKKYKVSGRLMGGSEDYERLQVCP